MTTATTETRAATDLASRSLARRVAAGEIDETDARIQIAVYLTGTDIAEKAVHSALLNRPTNYTTTADLVHAAKDLLFDLCTDTNRKSALNLARLAGPIEVSVCGWAYKLVQQATKYSYDRVKTRREAPECDMHHGNGQTSLRNKQLNVANLLGDNSWIDNSINSGFATPIHPTLTVAPIDHCSERLLDAAEVHHTLVATRIQGSPMWIEVSTRSIIAGFGINQLPRRLVGDARQALLAELDANPRWAHSQVTALVAERDGELCTRSVNLMVRDVIGHLGTEGLRDLSEHHQACDMVCRYGATPAPVVAKNVAAAFRTDVADTVQGTVTSHMVSRLCNHFMASRAEMTASDRSAVPAVEKTPEQRAKDAALFIKTCTMFLRRTCVIGTTVEQVASSLELILDRHLSCRTIAAA